MSGRANGQKFIQWNTDNNIFVYYRMTIIFGIFVMIVFAISYALMRLSLLNKNGNQTN